MKAKLVKESLNEDILGARSWGTLAGDNSGDRNAKEDLLFKFLEYLYLQDYIEFSGKNSRYESIIDQFLEKL